MIAAALESQKQPISGLFERNKLRPNFLTRPFAFGQREFCFAKDVYGAISAAGTNVQEDYAVLKR